MGNVLSQLSMVGEPLGEMPVFVNLGNVQLVERTLGVDSSSWIACRLLVVLAEKGLSTHDSSTTRLQSLHLIRST